MNPKGNYAFHTGYLFAIASALNSTPRRIATLQETQFSFKGSNKELMGENTFAEAVGRSDVKITGSAKTAKFSADAFNDIFFNQTAVVGHKKIAYDEAGAIATESYTATNGANFVQDLGVMDVTAGLQLKRVASAPATGQYAINEATGVYTFATVDEGHTITVTYVYADATAGKTIPLINMLAGEAPTFQALFFNKFQGKTVYLKLNAAVADSLDFGFKMGDFAIPGFSFMAQADANGNVGEYSQSDA
jgi:hypothetical protein